MSHLRQAWRQRIAVNDIPLDQIVYIAEGAMERGGHRGKRWSLAKGHPDKVPEVREDREAISRFATEAARYLGYQDKIKVFGGDDSYSFRGHPTASGMTDVFGNITVRYNTNDLTVLHEVAHVVTNTMEGQGGHSPEFCRAAHKLYSRFISPAAGEVFWNIVGERL